MDLWYQQRVETICVAETRKLVPPDCWHHCPGTTNPADVPSRGLSSTDVKGEMVFWLEGPMWLKEEQIPESEDDQKLPELSLMSFVRRTRRQWLSVYPWPYIEPLLWMWSGLVPSVSYRESWLVFQLLRRKDIKVESRRLIARDKKLAHKHLLQITQSTYTQNRRFELQFILHESTPSFPTTSPKLIVTSNKITIRTWW